MVGSSAIKRRTGRRWIERGATQVEAEAEAEARRGEGVTMVRKGGRAAQKSDSDQAGQRVEGVWLRGPECDAQFACALGRGQPSRRVRGWRRLTSTSIVTIMPPDPAQPRLHSYCTCLQYLLYIWLLTCTHPWAATPPPWRSSLLRHGDDDDSDDDGDGDDDQDGDSQTASMPSPAAGIQPLLRPGTPITRHTWWLTMILGLLNDTNKARPFSKGPTASGNFIRRRALIVQPQRPLLYAHVYR